MNRDEPKNKPASRHEEIIAKLDAKITEIRDSFQYQHTRAKYYNDGLNLKQQVELLEEAFKSLDDMEELSQELTNEFEILESGSELQKENENGK